MGRNIFGFLKYFGRPFNLKKRPSTLQISLFFITSALSCFSIWKEINPIWGKKENWYASFAVFLLVTSEATVVAFFSAKNLRPRHPLIGIVEELEEIMDSGDTTDHGTWNYANIVFTLPYLLFAMYHDIRLEKELLKFVPIIFNLVKELIILTHLAQVLVPFHVIASGISQVRARLQSCGRDPDPSEVTLELVVIERRLEGVFNLLIEEYGKDFVRIVYILTGRTTLSLCGLLIVFREDLLPIYMFLIPIFFLTVVSAMYKIWSVAHAAQAVKYQVNLASVLAQ